MGWIFFGGMIGLVALARSLMLRFGVRRNVATFLSLAIPLAPALIYSAMIAIQLATTSDPSTAMAGVAIPLAIVAGVVTGSGNRAVETRLG